MIFYFTGTGNSLFAAKKLQREGEGLIDIGQAVKEGNFSFSLPQGERVGFVFPVYCYTVGDSVAEFAKKLKIEGGGYAFAVIPCGASVGGAGGYLNRLLTGSGISLSYVAPLVTPDNGIFFYDTDSKEKSLAVLRSAEKELETIKAEIEAEKEKKSGATALSGVLRGAYHLMNGTGGFTVSEKCVSCGLCEKICPSEAIRLQNGHPVWVKKHCNKCAGCINRCPVSAINFGKKTERRIRYVNPEI